MEDGPEGGGSSEAGPESEEGRVDPHQPVVLKTGLGSAL